jgi:hypothetical protein
MRSKHGSCVSLLQVLAMAAVCVFLVGVVPGQAAEGTDRLAVSPFAGQRRESGRRAEAEGHHSFAEFERRALERQRGAQATPMDDRDRRRKRRR